MVDLTLRFARENPAWGFDRIQGALANVGYYISDTTVGNILKTNGFEPAPDRQHTGSWSTFLKAHWDALAAINFTTLEVWNKGGLVTFYLLFVMELKTRHVHFAGCTPNPLKHFRPTKLSILTMRSDRALREERIECRERLGTHRRSGE